MTTLPSLLVLGFLLGMRHATDADHVVAVTTLVRRDGSLRGAALVGSLWGAGHTAMVFVVGGAMVLFDLVIPPRLGLALELAVGVMLVVLGAASLRSAQGRRHPHAHDHHHHAAPPDPGGGPLRLLRPLAVGTMHGLAGSAGVALLVLGTIRRSAWALAYLAVFGVGTVAGMVLITAALSLPLRAARGGAGRERWIGIAAGLVSMALGLFMVYRVGFVDGLFTSHPRWTPS